MHSISTILRHIHSILSTVCLHTVFSITSPHIHTLYIAHCIQPLHSQHSQHIRHRTTIYAQHTYVVLITLILTITLIAGGGKSLLVRACVGFLSILINFPKFLAIRSTVVPGCTIL